MKCNRLLLFDIDCTLLNTGGAGMAAFHSAAEELYSEQIAQKNGLQLDMAGSTDFGLIMEIFKSLGVQDSIGERDKFFQLYLSKLKVNLSDPKFDGQLLPGVVKTLNKLSEPNERYDIFIGLLTGNLKEGAKIKVEHYGIEKFFTFGAYGCDHFDRNELGPIALDRAHDEYGILFDPQETIVIGDTPKDINCAKAFGARSFAVATGSFSIDQLMNHSPDYVLDDLDDWEQASRIFFSK